MTANLHPMNKASVSRLSTISLTFLGTASAQPSPSRNHSSLALQLGGDVWLFDCGEATQHRIQRSVVKFGKINKIFITHTHGDHIFGLLPVLASRLNGAGGMTEGAVDPRLEESPASSKPSLEVYGPLGTRAYIRSGIKYTHTFLGDPYVVHELRLPSDPVDGDFTELPLAHGELPHGRNILQENGVWKNIFQDSSISVSAAPILHSCPCVGYTIQESPLPGKMNPKEYLPHLERTNTPKSVLSRLQKGESIELSDGTILHGPSHRPGRKITILGDTYDPSPIAELATNSDVLIHEATNAHLPGIDPNTKAADTYETLEERAKSRGHSTPQMAGAFASRIQARSLILNHFSAKYPGDDDVNPETKIVMDAIASLAAQKYAGSITCARDLMTITI